MDTGCKWRALPRDFPPWSTVYKFFARWTADGTVGVLRDQLRRAVRTGWGKTPPAVAVIIDSQSVKAAETVARNSRGYDAAKRINGPKRHLVVDIRGLPLLVMVTPADLTDRDVVKEVLFRLRLMHPQITVVWADSPYAGQLVDWAKTRLKLTINVVSRPPGHPGFIVLPRRWIVERSLSWITRARRNVRDYKRLPQHSEAHITWAAITLMTRRLTRRGQPPEPTVTPPFLARAARRLDQHQGSMFSPSRMLQSAS